MMRQQNLIKRTLICLASTAAALIASAPNVASADSVIYTNTVARIPLVGDQSANLPGVIFDDVLINQSTNQTFQPVTVSKVTYGILQEAGAPADTIRGYYATVFTPLNATDFPVLNNNSVTQFGIATLPANTTGARKLTTVDIMPSVPFTVPVNTTDQLFFSEFAIGLRFDLGRAGRNGWDVADPDAPNTSANYDGAWDYDVATSTSQTYSLGTAGNPIYTTFNVAITGSVVPEPTSAVLLLAGSGLMLLKRRTR